MNNNPVTVIFDYTAKLLKQYNELKNDLADNIYRIIEVKKIPQQDVTLVIQLIGKSTFVEALPKDIVKDDRMLEGFSKKDIRTITYYAFKEEHTPRFKIVSRYFCEKLNKLKFKIIGRNGEDVTTATATELASNKDILQQLAPLDINAISYTAGYEHAQD